MSVLKFMGDLVFLFPLQLLHRLLSGVPFVIFTNAMFCFREIILQSFCLKSLLDLY